MNGDAITRKGRFAQLDSLLNEISGNHAFDALGVLLSGLDDEMDFFWNENRGQDLRYGLKQIIDLVQEWNRERLRKVFDLVKAMELEQ